MLYRIWYKEKDTKPLMPCCIPAIGKRERNKKIKEIQNDSRFKIVAVTEHAVK